METIRFKGVVSTADASAGVEVTLYELGSPPDTITILAGDQISVESVVMSTDTAGLIEVHFGAAAGAHPDSDHIIGYHAAANMQQRMNWEPGTIIGQKGYKVFLDHAGTTPDVELTMTGVVYRRANA